MSGPAPLDTHLQAGLLTAPYRRGAELLDVPLGADLAGATTVGAYAFSEYHTRYGREPLDPRYLLVLKKDTGPEPLSVTVDFQVVPGPVATAAVAIPAHSLAGMSFYIPLPRPVPEALRLKALRQTSAVIPGPGADLFGVVALLGNIARLLWIIGAEKDEVRRQIGVVHDQRRLPSSQRVALDLLGADLRVARFPAREYSFDAETIALYHCNDAVPDLGAVADETTRFGLPGHPGVNHAAESGVDGQFGAGFGFPGPQGAASITIDDHADFALPPSLSTTIEAFVNVAAAVSPAPRVLLLKGTVDAACTLTAAGWSIVAGEFRGIPNNVRCSLSDGNPANGVDLFADLNLAGGRFHHVAVVVDRAAARARLLVDGQERASDAIRLAALTNGERIRVGSSPAGHACTGVIDEIRFSRVARTLFHPALGEGDEAYRTRLGIFERWTLPTPAELTSLINGSVSINGDPESFVIAETTRPFVVAAKAVRVMPSELPAGASIDREGDGRVAIDAALDDAEPIFDDRLLVTHANANVVYGENAKRMQAVARRALDRFLGLIVGQPGKLHLDKAFDPSGPVRHSTGRTLRFSHDVVALAALGSLAHRAGFDFVRNTGSFIEATVGLGDELEPIVEPRAPIDTPPDGVDVLPTKSIDLHVDPGTLPTAGEFRWTLIPCGAGRARLVAHPSDAVALTTPVDTRPHLRLTADAPGRIVVKVDYALGGRVYTGTRTMWIGVAALADNTAMSAAGEFNLTEEHAAGQTGAVIDPILLVVGTHPLIDYGANPDNKRIQVTLDRRLARLADAVGGLRVLKAFDAADPGRHHTGLAAIVDSAAVTVDVLGARAHHAGFDYVRRQGTQVFCALAQRETIEIVQQDAALTPIADVLVQGTSTAMRVRPTTLPATGSFTWSTVSIGRGSGTFDQPNRAQVTCLPITAGATALNALYVQPGTGVMPYTFDVRLNAALQAANARIPKDSYDLVMNILNHFHPIGVEINTAAIRKQVVEVEQDPLKAFPAYTYPEFRL